MKLNCGRDWTDVAVRVALVCFFLAVWLPNLGCDEQQELLGVESAEAVVETAYDVVLAVAAVLGMRASSYLMPRRRQNMASPCPTGSIGPCSFM
jgi:hypothetical protein